MSLLDSIRSARNTSKFSGPRAIKPPTGKSRWRVLPHWSGDENKIGFHPFGLHYIKDLTGEMQAVYLCNDATNNQECEVCARLAIIRAR